MKSLLLLALAVILGSCAMQKKTNAPDPKIISYQSSSCFGSCAEQQLTINKKRNMNYVGIKNVDNVGNFNATLSEEDYNKLLLMIKVTQFSQMDSTYFSSLKDIQKITISSENKSVSFHERNATKELKVLSAELNRIISKSIWTE